MRGPLAGTPLAGQRGAIAYDHAALKYAKSHGITGPNRDQWRRATAQAAPGLQYLSRLLSLPVLRYAVRLAVAVFLTAAAGLGVPAAAQAATCSTVARRHRRGRLPPAGRWGPDRL